MVELGFSELTTEQIEVLSQISEDAARKTVLSKVTSKQIDRLDIAVEVDGAKPVNVTVEVNLELLPQAKNADAQAIVQCAVEAAQGAAENFLKSLK